MSLFILGLSHKTAPVSVRETFNLPEEERMSLLRRICTLEGVHSGFFLITCNRAELILCLHEEVKQDDSLPNYLVGMMAEYTNISAENFASHLYEKRGDLAVRHLFRVAASLDSMVVGEPQILGQMKDAFALASKELVFDAELSKCMHHAFKCAKRIRTETLLGKGNVSISSVACDLAKQIFGDLSEHTVLLLGAGEMAEAAAKSMLSHSKHLRVCNRNFEKACQFAKTFGGAASQLSALEDELFLADVVIVSTGSESFLVTKEMVKRVMKKRKGRTLFFIDISVPRNVDPSIHALENAYVYNVDDLEQEVKRSLETRASETVQAEQILEEEIFLYDRFRKEVELAPLIVAMRSRMKGILEADFKKNLSQLGVSLGSEEEQMVKRMVEGTTNKCLHSAITSLKRYAGTEEAAYVNRMALEFFGLQEDNLGFLNQAQEEETVTH